MSRNSNLTNKYFVSFQTLTYRVEGYWGRRETPQRARDTEGVVTLSPQTIVSDCDSSTRTEHQSPSVRRTLTRARAQPFVLAFKHS